MQPVLRPEAFSDSDWLFELKYDGFRCLAYVDGGHTRLVSKNGHEFSRFKQTKACLEEAFRSRQLILDGEVVCVDAAGRPVFKGLMEAQPGECYYVFDLLWLDGMDLRDTVLSHRKSMLRSILPPGLDGVRYVDYVEGSGEDFFLVVCENDLEGMVAKHRASLYNSGARHTWRKIKNRRYSQRFGREKYFAGKGTRRAHGPA